MQLYTGILFFLLVNTILAQDVHLGFPFFSPPGRSGRVVGGTEAKKHAAPYIVSLQYFGHHFCGGSIIADSIVVTAAHCISPGISSNFQVIAGAHTLGSRRVQSRTAVRSVRNPDFAGDVAPNDVALVFVNKPFKFNSAVQKIDLPIVGSIPTGTATLYGWGSTSTSSKPSMPKNLQTVDVPLLSYKECEDAMGGPGATPLADTNVCTGPLTGGISSCSGDSGGPLVKKENGKTVLIGIVSWGYVPCGIVNAPSVYTRVSAFVVWIRKNMVNKGLKKNCLLKKM